MIDLASFFTIQNTATPQIGAGQGELTPELAALKLITGETNKSSDKDGEESQSIFDILLNQIEQQIAKGTNGEEQTPITARNKEPLESDNPALTKNPKLDLVRLLANNKDVAEDVTALDRIAGLDLIDEIKHTLALNQQLFDDALEAGTGNGDLVIDKETGEISLPDISKTLHHGDEKNAFFSNNIRDLISKIESLIEKADPALLNTINITPEQLTTLQSIQTDVALTEQQVETAEEIANNILIGLVAIVPPPVKQDIIIQPQTLKSAGKPASLDLITPPTTPANDLAARLNNLVVGNNDKAPASALPFSNGEAVEGDVDFEAALKEVALGGKKYAGNQTAAGEANVKTTPNNNAAQQPTPNVLEAWPFSNSGSLFGSANYSDQVAEQLGLSLGGAQSTAQGSLTSLVNQAHSAGQPHPATQMVMASMSKVGKGGTDTNIALRLDPPDLGRVDISMTFSKDKTVKAIVTVEKAETFMMLQRDAQVLERALQEVGLDTDGGLSFEMAQDGEFLDRHNQRGGGHDDGNLGGREGDIDGDDLEIIESTMSWSVDPETGHTRYNILA